MWGVVLVLLLSLARVTWAAPIAVSTAANLQTLIDANPTGTVFALATGIHRRGVITPKDGNVFVGTAGTILSGAVALTTWTASGSDWFATGQTQAGEVLNAAECLAAFPLCANPEDVFYDGVPLAPVASQAALAPGKFFFDYAADRIYIRDVPAGHTVETSVLPSLFIGAAKNVTLQSLVVEKYASPTQKGALQLSITASGWTIADCEFRHNHAYAIRLPDAGGWTLRNNNIHDNGHMGVAGTTRNTLLIGNTISANNYAGINPAFEAGGVKLVLAKSVRMVRNTVTNNNGPGLWCDINCVDILYGENLVTGNGDGGIYHEISYHAVIRRNVSVDNGLLRAPWVFGGQINVADGDRVETYGNTVRVQAALGNAIAYTQQERGSGWFGPLRTMQGLIHHNTVRWVPGTSFSIGAQGATEDDGLTYIALGNSWMDANLYYVDVAANVFMWYPCATNLGTLAQLQACGQDLTSIRLAP